MALSEQEQQALREIEQSLMADDPQFGAAVGSDQPDFLGGGAGGAITLRGVALGLLGLVMLLGGVMLSEQSMWFIALSVIGFLVMFAAGIWMLRGGGERGEPSGDSRQRRPAGRSRGPANDGLSRRMEENFRKRFEQ